MIMIVKTLTLIAAVALTGFAVKRMMDNQQAKPVRVKPNRRDDGRIKRLRQDPKTGQYYPED